MTKSIDNIADFGRETFAFWNLAADFAAIEDAINERTSGITELGINEAKDRLKRKFQHDAMNEYFRIIKK